MKKYIWVLCLFLLFPSIASAHFLSSIEERAVGSEAANLYETKNKAVEDHFLEMIQNNIVKNNTDKLNYNDGKNLRYLSNIKLSYENTINGFSFPGGYTYITYKMLNFLDINDSDKKNFSLEKFNNYCMLAFVVAHELGHYVNEDYLRKIDEQYNQQIFFSLLSGYGSPNRTTIENLSKELIYNQSTRDISFRTEKEADEKGMDLLKNDDVWSMGGAILFFKKLQALENQNKQLFKGNSSNPHSKTELRLERTYEYISNLSNNNIVFKDNKVFLYNKVIPGNIDDAYCLSGSLAIAISLDKFYQNKLFIDDDLHALSYYDGKQVRVLFLVDFSKQDYEEKNESYLNSPRKNVFDFIVNSAPKKKLY